MYDWGGCPRVGSGQCRCERIVLQEEIDFSRDAGVNDVQLMLSRAVQGTGDADKGW